MNKIKVKDLVEITLFSKMGYDYEVIKIFKYSNGSYKFILEDTKSKDEIVVEDVRLLRVVGQSVEEKK